MPYFQRSPLGDDKKQPTYKLHKLYVRLRKKFLNFSQRWKKQGNPLQVKIMQLSVKDLRAIYIKPNGNPEHNPGTQKQTCQPLIQT